MSLVFLQNSQATTAIDIHRRFGGVFFGNFPAVSDALIIEGCLARLKQKRPDEHSLLVAHYLYGISKRKLAKARKKDEKLIRIEIQLAEGFIDGCLSMLDLTLDLDV